MCFALLIAVLIRFEKEKYIVNEDAQYITVALLTNGPTVKNITMQYLTIDGTAQGSI